MKSAVDEYAELRQRAYTQMYELLTQDPEVPTTVPSSEELRQRAKALNLGLETKTSTPIRIASFPVE